MNIGILGCTGRMGQMIGKCALDDRDIKISGALSSPTSSHLSKDFGEFLGVDAIGVTITANIDEVIQNADVLIDFSSAKAAANHFNCAASAQKTIVSGVTGLSDSDITDQQNAAQKTAIVYSPNMSIGINLLFKLTSQVSKILDEDYDIEIHEAHHRHKVDSPSGTSLKLGKIAAEARAVDFDEAAIFSRTNQPRQRGEIGFSVIRGGDIIGEHDVYFAGPGENLILKHQAFSRDIYAKGALLAAKWVNGKSNGLYSMQDVLGLT
jgi:4-hydroxy-tetrahydrodipicolinate reductase